MNMKPFIKSTVPSINTQLKSVCSVDVCFCEVSCFTAWFDGHMGEQREGFCLSPEMCPKDKKKKGKKEREKERKKWMTHHILFFVGANEGSSFWSHLGVRNSQMVACLSWCLTVQTQVWTSKMKREQNISKPHIKRDPPPADVFEQSEKKNSVIFFFLQEWPEFKYLP